jgi:beta-lactamase regulating signal transducer with metallopeptidase domain
MIVGRRRPHLAYALWLVVLVKCFIPPLWGGPTNLFAHLTPEAWLKSTAAAPGLESGNDREHGEAESADPSANAVGTPANNLAVLANAPHEPNEDRLLAAWACGSTLLLGIAIGRGGDLGRRLRKSSQPASGDLQAVIERVQERLNIRRNVQVMTTSSDIGPVVAGLWPMRVYVPQILIDRLRGRELESLLMHELTHVRRRDTWAAALQFAAQIVWWFHPVVWWMNRELTRQRERCCDEEVVANLNGRRGDYARCLVEVIDARRSLSPLWGYPAVRPAELTKRRLEEIMKRDNMTRRSSPRWCALAAVAMAVVALPGAGAQSSAQQTKSVDSPAEPARSAALPPGTLGYGDGTPDGKKSLGGSGEVIRFELPKGTNKIRGIRIHGSRYGLPEAPKEDFEIIFVNEAFDEVLHTEKAPYELFRRGRDVWVRVNFKEAVELPEKFWVVLDFHAAQTKGVYVSYDTSTKGQHSRIGLPSSDQKLRETDFAGDWMVQLFLATVPAASNK